MTTPERIGFLATWNGRLRTPELIGYLQPGYGTSYPIPCQTADGLVVRHFYHASDVVGPDTMYLEPPEWVLTFSYPGWEFLGAEQTNFGLKPAFENTTITLTAAEREARRPLVARLEVLYEEVMANYPNPPSRDKAEELLNTLQQVAPAPLWPYYEALAHEFVDWVGKG